MTLKFAPSVDAELMTKQDIIFRRHEGVVWHLNGFEDEPWIELAIGFYDELFRPEPAEIEGKTLPGGSLSGIYGEDS